MKRKIIKLLAVLICLSLLCSCTGGDIMYIVRNVKDVGQLADERMEQIVVALKEKDKEALKSLFSPKAINEIDNFEKDVDNLFNFFQGAVETWERDSLSAEKSIRYGKKSVMIRFGILISTDIDDYSLFIIDYNTDTIDPDNEGVYMLEIAKQSYDGEWESWQDRMMPGISIVE